MEGYSMITEIGITAGDIWHYLDERDDSTLEQITQGIETDRDLILMSVGWLAREGHVTLRSDGGKFRISLKSIPPVT